MKTLVAGLMALLLIGSVACSKKEEAPPPPPPITEPPTTQPAPVSVSVVMLGKGIGADKKVTEAGDVFGAKDTIYASVETSGTGHAKLRAFWSFVKGGKTAKGDETTGESASPAPAVNEFHVSKPSGWPKGSYKVDIF